MDYIIVIFLLGVIVTFIVVVGLARAAEFAHRDSAERLELDSLPQEWSELAHHPRDASDAHHPTRELRAASEAVLE